MSISAVAFKDSIIDTSKAINTDWFTTDIVPNTAQFPGEMIKHIVQIHVGTSTVVTIQYKIGGTTLVLGLNAGVAITANSLHTEEFMLPNTVTGYNIQHATLTQNISAIIGETRDFQSVN